MFIVFIGFVIVPIVVLRRIDIQSSEIEDKDYNDIVEIIDEFPRLKQDVQAAFADDKITHEEYEDIHRLYLASKTSGNKMKLKNKLKNSSLKEE